VGKFAELVNRASV